MPNLMEMSPDQIKAQLVTNIIAQQNDAFRQREPNGGNGRWGFTSAINDEGPEFLLKCMNAVAAYDGFTTDNDPHATHEMGFMDVQEKKVWWKIDLYNLDLTGGSPEPTDLKQTHRVLTLMFPSDY